MLDDKLSCRHSLPLICAFESLYRWSIQLGKAEKVPCWNREGYRALLLENEYTDTAKVGYPLIKYGMARGIR